MADPKYSIMEAPGDGVKILWDFNFSGAEGTPGYISPAHVKCTVTNAMGVITNVPVVFNGPNTLRVEPAVPVGSTITIFRDTPKDRPLVNFTTTAILNEANLDRLARQSIYASAEMVDRFGVTKASADLANANALQAIADAAFAVSTSTAAAVAANAATVTANAASASAATARNESALAVSTANAAAATANAIDGKAQLALDIAGLANDHSNDAIVIANAATVTANGAASAAATATSTANTAKTTADTAKSTADSAAASAATANTTAANAVTTANAANTAAGNAVTTANTANGKADTASANATSAVNTANAAQSTANGIDAKATTALANANTALSTANTARDTANGVDAKATTALSNSTTALSTANAAQTTANAKLDRAMQAGTAGQVIPPDQANWLRLPWLQGDTADNRTGWMKVMGVNFTTGGAGSARLATCKASIGIEVWNPMTDHINTVFRIVICPTGQPSTIVARGPETLVFCRAGDLWWQGSTANFLEAINLTANTAYTCWIEGGKVGGNQSLPDILYPKAGVLSVVVM